MAAALHRERKLKLKHFRQRHMLGAGELLVNQFDRNGAAVGQGFLRFAEPLVVGLDCQHSLDHLLDGVVVHQLTN